VKTKAGDVEKLITDDRFKGMFEDEEFKRDPNSEAYRLLRPVSNFRQKRFSFLTLFLSFLFRTEVLRE